VTDAEIIMQPNLATDPRRIRVACEVAQASYLPWKEFARWASAAGFSDGMIWLDDLAIATLGRKALFVVRGSNESHDWLDNVDIALQSIDAPQVTRTRSMGSILVTDHVAPKAHRGHHRQALAGKEFLGDLMEAWDEVVFIGHSLGASVQAILLALLLPAKEKVFGFYPIGCPRPGDQALHDLLQPYAGVTDRIVGVWNGEPDLVTRVWLSRAGYWHVPGRPVMIGQHSTGVPFQVTGEEEWERFRARYPVSRWRARRVLSRLAWSVKAHPIDPYVAVSRLNDPEY
jgi:Lipase (class 3)